MNENQELFYIEIRKYSTGMINLNSNESDPAVIAATLKSVIEKIEEQYLTTQEIEIGSGKNLKDLIQNIENKDNK